MSERKTRLQSVPSIVSEKLRGIAIDEHGHKRTAIISPEWTLEIADLIAQLEAERDIYRKACERIRDKWVGGMAFHPTWEQQDQYIVRLLTLDHRISCIVQVSKQEKWFERFEDGSRASQVGAKIADDQNNRSS